MGEKNIYFFDGESIQLKNLRFQEREKGLIGLFSIEFHPMELNTAIFYPTQQQHFYHPTKPDCKFIDFLQEIMGIERSFGGKIGRYVFFKDTLYTYVPDNYESHIFHHYSYFSVIKRKLRVRKFMEKLTSNQFDIISTLVMKDINKDSVSQLNDSHLNIREQIKRSNQKITDWKQLKISQ